MNYKTIILPLVSISALAVKGLFGIEIGEELIGQITDYIITGIFLVISVIGIFKNHKKEDGK